MAYCKHANWRINLLSQKQKPNQFSFYRLKPRKIIFCFYFDDSSVSCFLNKTKPIKKSQPVGRRFLKKSGFATIYFVEARDESLFVTENFFSRHYCEKLSG